MSRRLHDIMKGDSHAHPFSHLAARLALAAVILFPTTAVAQPMCNERDNVLGHLAKKYGEAPVAVGVTTTGGLVELLTTVDGNTWTIIVTTPRGMSCLVAAGEGWRGIDRKMLEPEA